MSICQLTAKKSHPAKTSFAAKAIETNGWVLYDDTLVNVF